MNDLLEMSEEELQDMMYDNPKALDDLVVESKLPLDRLAEVFVKHPVLQYTILKYTDPIELYNIIYNGQVFSLNPANFADNLEEFKKAQDEQVQALNAIKHFIMQDPNYSQTPFANTVRTEPLLMEEKMVSDDKIDRLIEKKEAELASEENESNN